MSGEEEVCVLSDAARRFVERVHGAVTLEGTRARPGELPVC